MSYAKDELIKRNIPDIFEFSDGKKLTDKNDWEKRRRDIIDVVSKEMFGKIPQKYPFRVELIKESETVLGKKCFFKHFKMIIETPDGEASFPFFRIFPKTDKKIPLFINIAFNPENEPWRCTPVENIIDRGFGIILAYHSDITSDNNDFSTGIAKYFPREKYNCGKISLWAYAQSILMDYAQTLDNVDKTRIASIGHSRLGKTSLWCGLNDTRFNCVITNNSGCSGDAITRQKGGESVERIYDKFPFWFVPEYAKYRNNEDALPFDQHFLVGGVAPRTVVVGAAVLDAWADPYSEFLTCVAASPVYEFLGEKGFVYEDKKPEPLDTFAEGNIKYKLFEAGHFLGVRNWEFYMDVLESLRYSQ